MCYNMHCPERDDIKSSHKTKDISHSEETKKDKYDK